MNKNRGGKEVEGGGKEEGERDSVVNRLDKKHWADLDGAQM